MNIVKEKRSLVQLESKSINGLPKMIMGSKPIDGGHYIFTEQEKDEFLKLEPKAEKYMRPFIGADEFLKNKTRYILALQDCTPNELQKMPKVMELIKLVKKLRYNSSDKTTRKLGDTPTKYHLNVLPKNDFLLIPLNTSSRRNYIPIGYLKPPIIPSNANMIIQDADLGLFGLLTSNIHMIWLSKIGGKLGDGYRYSKGIVYNTFPVPKSDLKSLEPLAQEILDIRDKYKDSSLADLYDPDTMPADLLKAHQQLDKKVESLYRIVPFTDDDDRLEFLLEEYSKMIGNQEKL